MKSKTVGLVVGVPIKESLRITWFWHMFNQFPKKWKNIFFQEPGARPFIPNIKSQFQHVFIVVRVYNPCSENAQYSVAVSRYGNLTLWTVQTDHSKMTSHKFEFFFTLAPPLSHFYSFLLLCHKITSPVFVWRHLYLQSYMSSFLLTFYCFHNLPKINSIN